MLLRDLTPRNDIGESGVVWASGRYGHPRYLYSTTDPWMGLKYYTQLAAIAMSNTVYSYVSRNYQFPDSGCEKRLFFHLWPNFSSLKKDCHGQKFSSRIVGSYASECKPSVYPLSVLSYLNRWFEFQKLHFIVKNQTREGMGLYAYWAPGAGVVWACHEWKVLLWISISINC